MTSRMPNGRRITLAELCRTQTMGRSTVEISSIGRATRTASASARSSVSAFGTSSPRTTERYVTSVKAMT
jgi:hypothetical protein